MSLQYSIAAITEYGAIGSLTTYFYKHYLFCLHFFGGEKTEVRKAAAVEEVAGSTLHLSLFTSKWQALRALWKISFIIHQWFVLV